MLTKQALLGLGLMIGGGVIIFALANQPLKTAAEQLPVNNNTGTTAAVLDNPSPLTADIETEMRILAQKQKERQAKVQAAEAESKRLLAEQEAARTEALNKATALAAPTVQARPEAVALAQEQARQEALRQEKAKQETPKQEQISQQNTQAQQTASTANNRPSEHRVQAGDNLIRLSRQYNIPVSALAAANNMGRNDPLHRGRTIKIPSQNEIAALEAKARQLQEQEQAQQAAQARQQNIDERLNNARREARRQGINERYSVQVALAANQDNADALASRFKAAGYQVSTSPDRRGVRVIVGPERSREAATALKDKINNDPNAGTRGAWVIQP